MRHHIDQNAPAADGARLRSRAAIVPPSHTEVTAPSEVELERDPHEGASAATKLGSARGGETHIVVLGGGFGGVLATRRIERWQRGG